MMIQFAVCSLPVYISLSSPLCIFYIFVESTLLMYVQGKKTKFNIIKQVYVINKDLRYLKDVILKKIRSVLSTSFLHLNLCIINALFLLFWINSFLSPYVF